VYFLRPLPQLCKNDAMLLIHDIRLISRVRLATGMQRRLLQLDKRYSLARRKPVKSLMGYRERDGRTAQKFERAASSAFKARLILRL